MARDFRIPRRYKTVLALVAVLGPIVWLMFTEDGQRRTDLVLMSILGRPAFDAALESFTDRLTEDRLRADFPAIELACTDGESLFGDRSCEARIGSFNQYPASELGLFFDGGRLSAVKVLYPRAYHARIRGWVERRVARLREVSEGPPPAPLVNGGVAAWPVTDGALLLKDGDLGPSDEPALLWLSGAALARREGPGGA
ncbi:MAG: hypothetical protein WAK53_17780 [Chromatiaceae bacterium]